MNDRTARVNGWEQLTMTQPEVVEITLRVGLVPREDHCQIMLEWRDPRTDKLLGCETRPHVGLGQMDDAIANAVDRLLSVSARFAQPF